MSPIFEEGFFSTKNFVAFFISFEAFLFNRFLNVQRIIICSILKSGWYPVEVKHSCKYVFLYFNLIFYISQQHQTFQAETLQVGSTTG